MVNFKSVDDYIASNQDKQQKILEKIRLLIKKHSPKAEEKMGYGVASFRLNGKPLIYYAAFKKHIGLYPVPEAKGKLAEEIKAHQTGRGTMQFSLSEPIPYDLIIKIVKAREVENDQRA